MKEEGGGGGKKRKRKRKAEKWRIGEWMGPMRRDGQYIYGTYLST